jgi:hypothetical protein
MAGFLQIWPSVILRLMISVIIFFSVKTYASEVDSYTNTQLIRDEAITDINNEINSLIKTAVDTANLRGLGHPEELYLILNKTLGGRIVSRLEKILEHKNDGRVLKVDIKESIYSELGFFKAPSLILSRKMGGGLQSR